MENTKDPTSDLVTEATKENSKEPEIGATHGSEVYREPPSPDDIKKFLTGLDHRHVNLADYNEREYYSHIVANFLSVRSDRDEFYKALEQIQNFYLVQLIVDVLSDDVLTEDHQTGAMIQVSVSGSSNDNQYTKDIQEMCDKFDVPGLIVDILEELLIYGEYAIEMQAEKGVGITKLLDNVPVNSVLALYESHFPYVFYKVTKDGVDAYSVNSFAHFCISARKTKVIIPKTFRNNEKLAAILESPVFRVGRSVFYGALEKLKELYMLEKAVSASTFFSLTRGNIVSISMPPSMNLDDMFEITQKYESLLNGSKLTTLDVNNIDQVVRAIKDSFTTKVIPGFSEKGQLEKVDVSRNNESKQEVLPNIRDSRESVVQTIGIPIELIFGEVESRRSALKQYVRYAKKVKTIQRAIQNGVRQICLNHLAHKHEDSRVQATDIQVNMFTDTNIDEIDNLEGIQLVTQNISEMTRLLDETKANLALGLEEVDFIDPSAFIEYLKSTLKGAGFRSTNFFVNPFKGEKIVTQTADNVSNSPDEVKD